MTDDCLSPPTLVLTVIEGGRNMKVITLDAPDVGLSMVYVLYLSKRILQLPHNSV